MTIKVTKLITSKLAFVKALKSNSSYGLYEAKEIADWLCRNIGKAKKIDISKDQARKMQKEIHECGIEGVYFSFDEERNLNLLKLGIGEEKDYIELLTNYILASNAEDIKSMLVTLNKDTLIKLCQKVSI